MRWAVARGKAPSLGRRLELSFLSRSLCLYSAANLSISNQLVISEQVLNVLHTAPSALERSLNYLFPCLTPHIVASVLDDPTLPPYAAFRFFTWASRHPYLISLPTHNRIISVLCSNGFDCAWQSLMDLSNQNILIPPTAFTVLISAYSVSGLTDKAVETFGRMAEFSCRPNTFAYNTMLQIFVDNGMILLGMAVYSQMLKSDCWPSRSTFGILMHGLCKVGKQNDALKLFDEMLQRGIVPNTMLYTVFLSSLCKADRLDDAIRLLQSLKEKNCRLDNVIYNALLSGFSNLGRIDEAFKQLSMLEKDGFSLNLNGYSCLIDGLFKAGRFKEACQQYKVMLDKNLAPDCTLYTILIKGYSQAGKVEEAFGFLKEMTVQGLVPDTFCYNTLIKGLCDVGHLDRARALFLEISENHSFPDSATYTIMICGLCNEGLVSDAQKIFDEMGKLGCVPTIVTFNALIDGLCKVGKLEEAHLLFCKMEMGKNPFLFLRLSQGTNRVHDSNSLRQMIENLCQSGQVLKAYKLLLDIINCGVVPDIVTFNILINCLCKVGNPEGAMKLFKELHIKGLSPDVITYGTLIDGFLRSHREEEASEVFQHMLQSGCTPNFSIYNTFMKSLCRRRRVSQAIVLWLDYLSQESGLTEEANSVNVIRKYFEQENLEEVIRGLIQMDRKCGSANSFPYTIWLIGYCQARKVDEALMIFTILKEFGIDATPASCVRLISCLCWERKLASALDVMLYAVDKGFHFMQPVGNRLIQMLCLHHKKDAAWALVQRMSLAGYDMDAYLRETNKILLYN